MKLKLQPRFFVIIAVLIIIGSSLAVLSFAHKGSRKDVLAASDSYKLIAEDGSQGSTSNSFNAGAIADYVPVTISYTVKEGDTLQSIAEKYHADAQTIADFPNNGLQKSLQLRVGQIVIVPNGYIDEANKPQLPPIARGTGQFSWPFVGIPPQGRPVITQYAYSWHLGSIDISIPLGTEVRAADDGTVKVVERLTTGYGIHVIIDHGGELTSLYGHLSEVRVTQGQGIHKGDLVGLSGSTGHSTGPHLHFEVRRGVTPVDPMTLLPPVN